MLSAQILERPKEKNYSRGLESPRSFSLSLGQPTKKTVRGASSHSVFLVAEEREERRRSLAAREADVLSDKERLSDEMRSPP